jgi:hypothetical protein
VHKNLNLEKNQRHCILHNSSQFFRILLGHSRASFAMVERCQRVSVYFWPGIIGCGLECRALSVATFFSSRQSASGAAFYFIRGGARRHPLSYSLELRVMVIKSMITLLFQVGVDLESSQLSLKNAKQISTHPYASQVRAYRFAWCLVSSTTEASVFLRSTKPSQVAIRCSSSRRVFRPLKIRSFPAFSRVIFHADASPVGQ